MGRPRTFDNAAALESAMKLFWSKGYKAASLDDLEIAMNLRRTSIYNAFGNKRQLFQAALECYSEDILSGWISNLNARENVRSGLKNLLGEPLKLHFRPDTPGGCLIGLTTMESEHHDEATLRIVARFFRNLNRGIEHYLQDAKKSGALPAEFDEKALAAVVSTIIPGLILSARGRTSRTVLDRAIKGVLELIPTD